MRTSPAWAAVAVFVVVGVLFIAAVPGSATVLFTDRPLGRELGPDPDFLAPAPSSAFESSTALVWRTGGPYGGDVQALALSPNFAADGVAFAGGWRRGFYGITGGYGIARTTDGGASWSAAISSPPYDTAAVFDIAISPAFATDRTVLAATAEGLLRSRDGGVSWMRLNGGLPAPGQTPEADDMTRVRLSPGFATAPVVLATSQRGSLFRSADGGDHWSLVSDNGAGSPAFSRDFATNQTAFAAAAGSDLLRSTDGGQHWAVVWSSPGAGINDILETADGGLLLAAAAGVLRLVPNAAGYALEPAVINTGGAAYRLSTAGDNIYAATATGLYISMSFGRGWERVPGTPAAHYATVAACPLWGVCRAVLAGNSVGLLGTYNDNQGVWASLNGPRPVRAEGVAASPNYDSDATLFAATDHGVYRSTDAGANWTMAVTGAEPGSDYSFRQVRLSPSYSDDKTLFALYANRTALQNGVYRSTDGGGSWTAAWIPGELTSLAVSPAFETDHTVFAAGGDALYRSTDGGGTWTHFSMGSDGFVVYALAVSPNYTVDHALYATGLGPMRRSSDGGATWTSISGYGPSYAVVISPEFASDQTIWHTYRAMESPGTGDPESGVRRSVNAGGDWSWATAGLPGGYEPYPRVLALSPAYAVDHSLLTALSGQFVTSSSHSIYHSANRGDTWVEIGAAPGNPDVFDVVATGGGLAPLAAHVASAAGVWHFASPYQELVANGGFELNAAWIMPSTVYPAGYTVSAAHSGTRSLRAGITSGDDIYSYSSGYQEIFIPGEVLSATLSFWWYPQSAEPPSSPGESLSLDVLEKLANETLPEGALAGDFQYVLVLDDHGNLLSPLIWERRNSKAWLPSPAAYDLSAYRGRTIRIQFGVYNDGKDGATSMFVDDVSLMVRRPGPALPSAARTYLPVLLAAPEPAPTPTVTVTPTSTPTPTPTPQTPVCYEGFANPGFEAGTGWSIRPNPVLAAYVTTPAHAGQRSMRTGIKAGGANVESYSPVEQELTFPSLAPFSVSSVRLGFWRYNVYGDGALAPAEEGELDWALLPQTEAELADFAPATDFFYAIAIHDTGAIDWLLVERSNTQTWRYHEVSLDPAIYEGRHVRFQFGTYNGGSGGISRTYVDDAALHVCPPLAPTPTPTPIGALIPTAIATPWPTPYVSGSLPLASGRHPHGIAFDGATGAAYVAFHGDDHAGNTLGIIGASPLALLGTVDLDQEPGGPNAVALLGGGRVVVSNRQTGRLTVVDAVSRTVVGRIATGLLPNGLLALGPYGYSADFGSDTVTVFDPVSLGVMATLTVGDEPSFLVADEERGDVYLTLHGSGQVVRLRDGAVAQTYTGVPEPYGLAFDPASRRLYVANRGGNRSITVIDTVTGAQDAPIPVGREPFVLAVNPGSGHLFAACGDEVRVFDTFDGSLVTTLAVPAGADEGIAVDEPHSRVYVASGEGDAITVIQDAGAPQVLFGSTRDGNAEIYRMLPDGRQQARLTTSSAAETDPAGSPDGRWIAYTRTDGAGTPQIWVMTRDGRNARQLTTGPGSSTDPTWSPDAKRLAFQTDRDGNWEIYTLRIADGTLVRLTDNGATDAHPDWSWSQNRIVFESDRDNEELEIFTSDPDGGDIMRLTANASGDREPGWSPYGDRLVFLGRRSDETLYVLDAQLGTTYPLLSRHVEPGAPAWAPMTGAGYVVFAGYRPDSTSSEILHVNPDASGLVLLTRNEADDSAPGWLPSP